MPRFWRLLSSMVSMVEFLNSKYLWILVCVITVVAIAFSLMDLHDYAGIDLRNRVVGARALLLSHDPYATDWHPGVPLELADPQQRYPGFSRVSAVPPVLFAYVPFASMD